MARRKRPKMHYVPKRTVEIPTDPDGSYTGVPEMPALYPTILPTPVQDADDL